MRIESVLRFADKLLSDPKAYQAKIEALRSATDNLKKVAVEVQRARKDAEETIKSASSKSSELIKRDQDVSLREADIQSKADNLSAREKAHQDSVKSAHVTLDQRERSLVEKVKKADETQKALDAANSHRVALLNDKEHALELREKAVVNKANDLARREQALQEQLSEIHGLSARLSKR
jgi:DNA repair exonuclease SbcCD ATPase subunit